MGNGLREEENGKVGFVKCVLMYCNRRRKFGSDFKSPATTAARELFVGKKYRCSRREIEFGVVCGGCKLREFDEEKRETRSIARDEAEKGRWTAEVEFTGAGVNSGANEYYARKIRRGLNHGSKEVLMVEQYKVKKSPKK